MTPLATQHAVDDLRTVRDQWGELLAAIDTPLVVEWPPRETRGFLHTGPTDGGPLLVDDRTPLTLRPHPAPLNLDALDAALAVERALFDLADTLAAACQRPIRCTRTRSGRLVADQVDATDPHRWHYPSPSDPGSRAHGVHWAAVWIEGRLLDEPCGDLFTPVPGYLVHEAARTVRQCRRRVERALRLEARSVPVRARPCPWCGGLLVLHTDPDGPPTVTCSTGSTCSAPVPLDERGRRVWDWRALEGLQRAMEAGERRRAEADRVRARRS